MGYTLTIIDDESVALAGSLAPDFSSRSPLFLGTVLMIILVAAIIIGAAYAIRLHFYQTRLLELSERIHVSDIDYNSRSIRSLRNQIAVVEGNLAENSLGGFVPMT